MHPASDEPPPIPADSTVHDGCPGCGYSLRGLAFESGRVRCPECGRASTAAELRLQGVIPPALPGLLVMILPAWGLGLLAALVSQALRPNTGPAAVILFVAYAWGLAAPWMVVRHRAGKLGDGYFYLLLFEEGFTGLVISLLGASCCLCVGFKF
ncbi:MAG: hypothetical protein DYG92_02170 [Leptolyngbya sp. PLA1]|nr:hypothetical protein [Leptolyngbya sp. PLA1]